MTKDNKITPPNTGSNVHMKKDGYTWEDLDRSYWEGFDNAKNKMEERIAELEKENAELKTLIKSEHEIEARKNNGLISQITEAKEIINEFIRISAASTEEFEPEFFELIKRAEDFVNKE